MGLQLRAAGSDNANGQAGIIFPTQERAAYGTQLAVANRGHLVRGVPSRSMTIVTIAFVVTSFATNDDPVDVGIYDSTGAKLVSSGATTGKVNTAAGRKTIAITPTTLQAGTVYFAALSYGAVGGTAATLMGANFGNVLVYQMFGTGFPQVEGDARRRCTPCLRRGAHRHRQPPARWRSRSWRRSGFGGDG